MGEPGTGARKSRNAWWRRWMRTKVYIGGSIVLIFTIVGALGPLVAPYDPNHQSLETMLQGRSGSGDLISWAPTTSVVTS